jgi:hypothetical protein
MMSIDLSSSSSFEPSATIDDKQPRYLSSSCFCFAVVKEDDECNLSPSWSFEASASNDNKQLHCLSSFFLMFFFVTVKAHHPLQVWRLTQVMTMSNMPARCHSSSFPKEVEWWRVVALFVIIFFCFFCNYEAGRPTWAVIFIKFWSKCPITMTNNATIYRHSSYFPRLKEWRRIAMQLVVLFKF